MKVTIKGKIRAEVDRERIRKLLTKIFTILQTGDILGIWFEGWREKDSKGVVEVVFEARKGYFYLSIWYDVPSSYVLAKGFLNTVEHAVKLVVAWVPEKHVLNLLDILEIKEIPLWEAIRTICRIATVKHFPNII